MEERLNIKVKALAWIEDEGMLFVVKLFDTVKQDIYYRAVGGTVEFGEPTRETLQREAFEELNAEIEIIGEPLILENLFTCDGKPGHEIDFLYPCRFSNNAFYERKTFSLVEADGVQWDALWIPLSDCISRKLRLVPEAFLDWYISDRKSSEFTY